jgi:hypothetical protein
MIPDNIRPHHLERKAPLMSASRRPAGSCTTGRAARCKRPCKGVWRRLAGPSSRGCSGQGRCRLRTGGLALPPAHWPLRPWLAG